MVQSYRRIRNGAIANVVVCVVLAFGMGIGGYYLGFHEGRASKQKTKIVYLTSDNSVHIKTDTVIVQADESIRVMDVPKELNLKAKKGK